MDASINTAHVLSPGMALTHTLIKPQRFWRYKASNSNLAAAFLVSFLREEDAGLSPQWNDRKLWIERNLPKEEGEKKHTANMQEWAHER